MPFTKDGRWVPYEDSKKRRENMFKPKRNYSDEENRPSYEPQSKEQGDMYQQSQQRRQNMFRPYRSYDEMFVYQPDKKSIREVLDVEKKPFVREALKAAEPAPESVRRGVEQRKEDRKQERRDTTKGFFEKAIGITTELEGPFSKLIKKDIERQKSGDTSFNEILSRPLDKLTDTLTFGASKKLREKLGIDYGKADNFAEQVADKAGEGLGLLFGGGAAKQVGGAFAKGATQRGRELLRRTNELPNTGPQRQRSLSQELAGLGAGAAAFKGTQEFVEGFSDRDIEDRNAMQEIAGNMRFGTYQMVDDIGNAFNWRGHNKVGDKIKKFAEENSKGFNTDYSKEFSWKSFLDPEYYRTTVSQSLPSVVATLPLGVIGYGAGVLTAGKIGLGAFGKTVAGAVGGTALSAPMESAMIAGGTFEEAQKRGNDESTSERMANEAFWKTLAVTAVTQAPELAAMFAPVRRFIPQVQNQLADISIRAGAAGTAEGVQEVAQEWAVSSSLGDDFKISEQGESFGLGFLIGGGMGLATSVAGGSEESPGINAPNPIPGESSVIDPDSPIRDIQHRAKELMSDEMKADFDEEVDFNRTQGAPQDVAEVQAWEAVAMTDEGKDLINQATRETIDKKSKEEMDNLEGQETSNILGGLETENTSTTPEISSTVSQTTGQETSPGLAPEVETPPTELRTAWVNKATGEEVKVIKHISGKMAFVELPDGRRVRMPKNALEKSRVPVESQVESTPQEAELQELEQPPIQPQGEMLAPEAPQQPLVEQPLAPQENQGNFVEPTVEPDMLQPPPQQEDIATVPTELQPEVVGGVPSDDFVEESETPDEDQELSARQKVEREERSSGFEGAKQAKEHLRNKETFEPTHVRKESGKKVEAVTFTDDKGNEQVVFTGEDERPLGPVSMDSFLKHSEPLEETQTESTEEQVESTEQQDEKPSDETQFSEVEAPILSGNREIVSWFREQPFTPTHIKNFSTGPSEEQAIFMRSAKDGDMWVVSRKSEDDRPMPSPLSAYENHITERIPEAVTYRFTFKKETERITFKEDGKTDEEVIATVGETQPSQPTGEPIEGTTLNKIKDVKVGDFVVATDNDIVVKVTSINPIKGEHTSFENKKFIHLKEMKNIPENIVNLNNTDDKFNLVIDTILDELNLKSEIDRLIVASKKLPANKLIKEYAPGFGGKSGNFYYFVTPERGEIAARINIGEIDGNKRINTNNIPLNNARKMYEDNRNNIESIRQRAKEAAAPEVKELTISEVEEGGQRAFVLQFNDKAKLGDFTGRLHKMNARDQFNWTTQYSDGQIVLERNESSEQFVEELRNEFGISENTNVPDVQEQPIVEMTEEPTLGEIAKEIEEKFKFVPNDFDFSIFNVGVGEFKDKWTPEQMKQIEINKKTVLSLMSDQNVLGYAAYHYGNNSVQKLLKDGKEKEAKSTFYEKLRNDGNVNGFIDISSFVNGGKTTRVTIQAADGRKLTPTHDSMWKLFLKLEGSNQIESDEIQAVGDNTTVSTSRGTEIEAQYALVDVNDLITSNNDDGSVNPNYPSELQPRQRTRQASQDQINRIAGKLNPNLLGANPLASDGAPIIGPDLVVESGNGRAIALKRVFSNNEYRNQLTDYQRWLFNRAGFFGLTNQQINSMENPVLVRIRRSDVDRVQFTQEANEASVSTMSATEQAIEDAGKMSGGLMNLFAPNDNGELNNSTNREFIQAFMRDVVSPTDRNRLLTEQGYLSQDGLNRVRNAVFALAYGDATAISTLAESTDNNVKTVMNQLLISASRVAFSHDNINNGTFHDLGINTNIVEAMNQLSELRKSDQKVEQFLNQITMFDDMSPISKELLRFLDDYGSGKKGKPAKTISSTILEYYRGLERLGDPNQVQLFEDSETPTREQLLEISLRKVTGDDDLQTSLFETEAEQDLFEAGPDNVTNEPRSEEGSTATPVEEPEQVEPAPNKFDNAREKLEFLDNLAKKADQYIKNNKNRMNVLPIDLFGAAAIVGANKIAHGVVDFAEWSDQMMKEYGRELRLSLRALYAQSEEMLTFSPEDWDEYLNSTGLNELSEGGTVDGAQSTRVTSEGTLEEAPSEDVQGTGTVGTTEQTTTTSTRPDTGSNVPDTNGAGTEESTVTGNERGTEGGTPANTTQPSVGSSTGNVDTTAQRTRSTGTRKSSPRERSNASVSKKDFQITNELENLGGAKTRFKNNVEALRTLVNIEKEGRLANSDEQKQLASYVGWGGISQAFDPNNKNWTKEYEQLRSLVEDGIITQEDYERARQSTTTAFYTSPEVVAGMYQALSRLGYKNGGRILEPSIGTGNFFGLMPSGMLEGSARSGVELDNLTARIAKQLYQRANIRNTGFQDYKIADGYFDIAIGNVPFGDVKIVDPTYKGATAFVKNQIHNYFFIKSLDKVRDGGIVAFVTSSGTMNSKTGKKVRDLIGTKADFLGAIRLPGNAFKENAGTEVTTDIIFLQKRPKGQKANHAGDFFGTTEVTVKDRDGKDVTVSNNEYFVNNPDMELGERTVDKLTGTRLGLTADGRNFNQAFNQAINQLPENIYSDRVADVEPEPIVDQVYFDSGELAEGGIGLQEGKLVQKVNGEVVKYSPKDKKTEDRIRGMLPVREAAQHVLQLQKTGALDSELKPAQAELNKRYDSYVKKFGFLNDQANRRAMIDDPVGASLLASIEKVKEEGEGKKKKITITKEAIFTERTINANVKVTSVDSSEEALVISLFENGNVDLDKMSQLSGKTQDQLINELQGRIYKNPTTETWETADQYLSGNVRQKFRDAQAAGPDYKKNAAVLKEVIPADLTPNQITVRLGAPWVPSSDMENFINDLLEVTGKIKVRYLPQTAQWFVEENKPNIRPLWQNARNTSEFGIRNPRGNDAYALKLIEDSLNLRLTNITYKDNITDATVVDVELTNEARQKQKQMQDIFQDWLWENEARAERLLTDYNEKYNSVRLPDYDGSIVYGGQDETNRPLPGMSEKYLLRPHQKDAVWRTIQGGNTLLAHVVGAGKTLEMIASGVELKRLGLISKPTYVVPNHLLDQWEKEFREAYPGANILKVGNDDIPSVSVQRTEVSEDVKRTTPIVEGMKVKIEDDTKKYLVSAVDGSKIEIKHEKTGKRQIIPRARIKQSFRPMSEAEYQRRRKERQAERGAALNKIAVGNYDAIIITHQTFQKLPMSPDTVQAHIREQVADLEVALRALAEDGENKSSRSVKALENAKTNLEAQIKENLAEENNDIAIPFEELGIDQIYVDESHMFKNLKFHTKMHNVAGLPQTNSQRAQDMFLKTNWLSETRNGRGVVFASGTPISNTMAEMYTLQRYLQMGELRAKNLSHFDAWAALFGESVTGIEIDTTGKFKQKTRFSRFHNVAELMTMFKTFADVKTADMLNLPTPDNVNYETVISPMSDFQEEYLGVLRDRAEAIKNGMVDPTEDNYLKLTGDGRKMALDIRMVNPDATDFEESKINKAADNIVSIFKDKDVAKDRDGNAVENHTQVVFLDMGTPRKKKETDEGTEESGADEGVSVYEDLKNKLVRKGIPKNQIAFIHEANTDKKKQALFNQMNQGEVRVLIGSTEKMGAGMNVQKRLVALHHLDAPWRPSDVEQREGRIVRQGNMNSSVNIYAYTTEGSFDANMWDTIRRKATFINQVMNGSAEVRSMEDVEASVMGYTEIVAVTSGNPLIQEQAELQKEMLDLTSAKTAYERSIREAKKAIREIPSEIQGLQSVSSSLLADNATKQDTSGDKFELTANNQTYTDRKEAGEGLIEYIEKAELTSDLDMGEEKQIGSYAGFPMFYVKGKKEPFELRGNLTYRFMVNSESALGTIRRVDHAINDLDKKAEKANEDVKQLEKNLVTYRKNAEKKFAKQKELDETSQKLQEVQKQILSEDGADQAGSSTEELGLEETLNMEESSSTSRPRTTNRRRTPNIPEPTIKEFLEPSDSIELSDGEQTYEFKQVSPKVAREVAEKLAKSMDTLFRKMKTNKRSVLGTFNTKSGGGRVRKERSSDIRVLAHELGHAFSHKFDFKENAEELISVYEKYYPGQKKSHKRELKIEEGLAEFFVLYLTDPSQIEKDAPKTYKLFEEFITNPKHEMKDVAKAITESQTLISNELGGSALSQGLGSVFSPGWFKKEPQTHYGEEYKMSFWKRSITAVFDFTIPWKDLYKAAEKNGYEGLDFTKLMALSGAAKEKARHTFISRPTDHRGRYIINYKSSKDLPDFLKGKFDSLLSKHKTADKALEEINKRTLESIVDEATTILEKRLNRLTNEQLKSMSIDRKELKKHGAYMVFSTISQAYRYNERAERGFTNNPMSKEVSKNVIEESRSLFPELENLIKEYTHNLSNIILTKLERGGVLTDEAKQRILAGSDFYIPTYYATKKAGANIEGGGQTAGSVVKRYSGSREVVYDMLTASLLKLTETEQSIEMKRTLDAIEKALIDTPNMNRFGTVVPEDKVPITVSGVQITKQIEGLLDDPITEDEIADQAFQLFIPGGLDTKRGQTILMNYHGNRKVYMHVAPELFNTFLSMRPAQIGPLVKMLSKLSQAVRWTSTTLNPRYHFNTLARDMFTAAFQTKSKFSWYHNMIGRTIEGGLISAGFGEEKTKRLVDQYMAAGSFMSATENVLGGLARSSISDGLKPTKWKNLKKNKGIYFLTSLAPGNVLQVLEQAQRYPEFKATVKRLSKDFGIDPEIVLDGSKKIPAGQEEIVEQILIEAGHAASEVTSNFSLHGSWEGMKTGVSAVPFLHGTLQGLYRESRQMKQNPIQTTLRLMMIGVPITVLAWALLQGMDEEDDISSETKDRYWIFPLDPTNPNSRIKWAVAKPFSYAVGLNYLERILDKEVSGDQIRDIKKDWWNPLRQAFFDIPLAPPLMSTILDISANKAWHGGAIVSSADSYLLTSEQYDPMTTSTFSKWLSREIANVPITNEKTIAPKKIDYFMNNAFGGIGSASNTIFSRIGEGLSDEYERPPGQKTLKERIVGPAEYNLFYGSFFLGPNEGGSRTIDAFYKKYNKSNELNSTVKKWAEKAESEFKKGNETFEPGVKITDEMVRTLQNNSGYRKMSEIMGDLRKEEKAALQDKEVSVEDKRQIQLKSKYFQRVIANIENQTIPKPPPQLEISQEDIENFRNFVINEASSSIAREQKDSSDGASLRVQYLLRFKKIQDEKNNK